MPARPSSDRTIESRSGRPSRRSVLRIGGGLIALAIGAGAGVLDRRRGDETGSSLDPAPSTTTSPSPTTAPTSTTTPAESTSTSTILDPVVPPDIPAGVLAVGSAYLDERPAEADLTTLLDALPAPDGDVVGAAAAAISTDFATSDTVVIDGWVLAVSEARAAAVLALLCPAPC